MFKELDGGNTEGDDQNPEGVYVLIYLFVFVPLVHIKAHSQHGPVD
jgi:hypothetical protein